MHIYTYRTDTHDAHTHTHTHRLTKQIHAYKQYPSHTAYLHVDIYSTSISSLIISCLSPHQKPTEYIVLSVPPPCFLFPTCFEHNVLLFLPSIIRWLLFFFFFCLCLLCLHYFLYAPIKRHYKCLQRAIMVSLSPLVLIPLDRIIVPTHLINKSF
ncbi:hypothetical protein ANANG_G00085650 [Anguilla anguilla]|uniref:Uncharacterized protein n=1 Tax=Anguilla anguilla TaxID=7936 RepID=A0A9D3S0K0_ANGAN|nr:hypothetical protein ANANG_G00085650 [Anguilla anguilla]